MWLRVFGVGLLLLGGLLIGPVSTRGPIFGGLRSKRSDVERWTYRVWFVRLIGALCLLGGLIYVLNPPAHFGG
jgi:hypothetical protein